MYQYFVYTVQYVCYMCGANDYPINHKLCMLKSIFRFAMFAPIPEPPHEEYRRSCAWGIMLSGVNVDEPFWVVGFLWWTCDLATAYSLACLSRSFAVRPSELYVCPCCGERHSDNCRSMCLATRGYQHPNQLPYLLRCCLPCQMFYFQRIGIIGITSGAATWCARCQIWVWRGQHRNPICRFPRSTFLA